MSRLLNLETTLFHPKKKTFLKYNNSQYCFETEGKNRFTIVNGIPNFFKDDNETLSLTQSKFYNEIKFPNYDSIDDFGSLLEKSEKSTFFKKLDKEIAMFSKVLEVGCGTGQLSLFLSRYQRQIFSIDLSMGSLELGENFRKKNNIENLFFLKMSLFNLFFKEEFFDVIISNGVLHHTENPKLAFMELTKYLKKDGYIIIGLYHRYGRIYTKIRQLLIKIFGDSFKFLDKKTLDKYSSKEKRFAWFMDQYKNPKESTHTFAEVLKWFNSTDIEFISSIPFSFPNNSLHDRKLFKKNKNNSKFKMLANEMIQCFSPQQIKEGGFFIMIGRKK
jgi:SAM-dependent methyltransferase|tara:strand:+ start:126 stop:1118 length:993 start_codon:yes stop_codon:yes gene_type:complete